MEALHSHERREWGIRFEYEQETKDRAVRVFEKRREEAPEESRVQSYRHLGESIGVPRATIRGWVDRTRVDGGEKSGVTTAEREEIKALRKELAEVVKDVHRDSFGVYDVRKLWHALERKGEDEDLGRDQVARLMRLTGVRGVSSRKQDRPARPALVEVLSPDLVQRRWFWLGFVVAASKTVALVTRTVEQAATVRKRANPTFAAEGALVHSDAGSQRTSVAFTEKLLDRGFAGSVGRVGTAYDDALIESTIGLYKTELVHRRATGWSGQEELEVATARWVAWFDRDRLHETLGYFTPIEIEAAYLY